MVVKDILRDIVDVSRVSSRGAKNNCDIILDNNDQKPICRLWVNRTQVYFGVVDENKKETGNRIGSFEDIHAFTEEIQATTQRCLADEQ